MVVDHPDYRHVRLEKRFHQLEVFKAMKVNQVGSAGCEQRLKGSFFIRDFMTSGKQTARAFLVPARSFRIEQLKEVAASLQFARGNPDVDLRAAKSPQALMNEHQFHTGFASSRRRSAKVFPSVLGQRYTHKISQLRPSIRLVLSIACHGLTRTR